jgi:AcrR family transcriptional regulator
MSEVGSRDKLKARMLEVAERILEVEGLGAVQARRIALASECSVGTLYNVFKGGLDDLIIEANDRTLQRLGQVLATARETSRQASVEDQLLALALAYLQFAIDHPTPWRAVFEHRMSETQTVPDWYRASQATLFALVEECLAGASPDPTIRRRAARALFSAVHGIVSLALDRKLGDFDPVETEAQIRLVVSAASLGLAETLGRRPAPPE